MKRGGRGVRGKWFYGGIEKEEESEKRAEWGGVCEKARLRRRLRGALADEEAVNRSKDGLKWGVRKKVRKTRTKKGRNHA